MPRTYTSAWHQEINSVSSTDPALYLLAFTHTDLVTPIRIVNDTQDLISNGDTYIASAFRIVPPDDREQGLPRASIAFDNVTDGPSGNSLAGFLETNDGGRGTSVTMSQVRRSDPNNVEWSVTMTLSEVAVNMLEITGRLGFEDILNRQAVALTYRPETAPGIY